VDFRIEPANGTAETTTALEMLEESVPGERLITVGGDKGYDTKDFVAGCRARQATPHIAQNISGNRGLAIDGRTTRHTGYNASQRLRKRVEEIFGWVKVIGGLRKTRFKGRPRTQLAAYLVGAAYNLLRIAKLNLAAA